MLSLPMAQFPQHRAAGDPDSRPRSSAPTRKTIEQSVATPIEQQMSGVDNMNYMYSINANNGLMRMFVNFDVKTDPNIDHVLTQLRYAQAESQLPADVRNYGVTRPEIALRAADARGAQLARRHTRRGLSRQLRLHQPQRRAEPGAGHIARCRSSAPGSMRCAIWVKPDQLAKLNITVPEIISAVSARTRSIRPASSAGRPSPPGQEFTYTVRAQGRLVTEEEFGNIVLRATPDGSIVRLKDVARIELGRSRLRHHRPLQQANPRRILALYQLPGSNAIEAAKGVKRLHGRAERAVPLGPRLPGHDRHHPSGHRRHREIGKTFWEALALVMLVVFVFLQGWRAALIPLLAVPVSLIGTFCGLPVAGLFHQHALALRLGAGHRVGGG